MSGRFLAELLIREWVKKGKMNIVATARHKTGIIVANLK